MIIRQFYDQDPNYKWTFIYFNKHKQIESFFGFRTKEASISKRSVSNLIDSNLVSEFKLTIEE